MNPSRSTNPDDRDAQHEVVILGWSARGLRCPDYTLDFRRAGTNEVHRVTLLQMPNGTGKTTTLQLLRAALSGRDPNGGEWDTDNYDIQELRKEGGGPRGQFEVNIRSQGKPWAFRLDFHFDKGEVDLFTTGPSGEEQGFRPPRALEAFLNRNFVRFFVFDGELAAELTDANKQNAEDAVDAMFQLSAFSTLQQWAQRYLDARIKKQSIDGDGATQSEKGLNKKRTLIAEIVDRLNELKREQQAVNAEDEALKAEEIKLRNASEEAIKQRDKFRERQDHAKGAQKDAEVRLDGLRRSLLQSLRDPHQLSPAFAKAMIEIRDGFDQVKLPEKSSREWFRELAEQAKNCICGRPLDDAHRDHILQESERYLGSDDVILLDRIKQAVAQRTNGEYEESDRDLNTLVNQVGDAFNDVGLAEDAYRRIVEEAAQEDPEVKRTELRLKEIYRLRAELATRRDRLEKPNQGDRPRIWTNVVETEKELHRQSLILEKQTGTVVLSDKRKRLHDLLDEIRRSGRTKLGETLAARVNNTLEELMPDNRVRLGSVGKSLRLRERGGASIGETLTVAYAFLTRLGHSSSYALPLIIDTPAAPIDEHIRGEIGLSLPQLVRQFIAFTISPERGAFVDALMKGSGGDVQFLTLFRASNVRLMKSFQSAKLPPGTVVETDDARLVRGIEFFNSFQDDSKYERHDAI